MTIKIHYPHYAFQYDKKLLRNSMRSGGTELVKAARAKANKTSGSGAWTNHGGFRHRASGPGQSPVSGTGAMAKQVRATVSKDLSRLTLNTGRTDKSIAGLFMETGAEGGGHTAGRRGGGEKLKNVYGKRRMYGVLKYYRISVNGPRVMARRPFISAAFDDRAASVAQRIKNSLINDIKFVRVKV